MSRIKLVIVLSLALVAVLGGGLVYAQEESPLPVGTAIISDDEALSDKISYMLMDIPAPGAGMAYEGWLVSDNGKVKLSTGVMDVVDGSVYHSFTSPDGENLIAMYDKVLITREPDPDADPEPSEDIAYSYAVAPQVMEHTRNLVVSSPEGEPQGILTSLQMQLDMAIAHAMAARADADAGNMDGVTAHIELSIDGIDGALLALAAARDQANMASEAAPEDPVIAEVTGLIMQAGGNVESWATQARDVASDKVMGASTTALAAVFIGPGANTVVSNLQAARSGSGNMDGADQAYVHAQNLATYSPFPGPLPLAEYPRPGIGLPSAGGMSVSEVAPMALLASLLLIVVGGALLVRRRARPAS